MEAMEVPEDLREFYEPPAEEDLEFEAPPLFDDCSTAVAITGLPIVPEAKFEKLMDKLRSVTKMDGCHVVDYDIPSEGGKGKGVVLVDCETPADAERLVKGCYTLDKETGEQKPKSFGSKNVLHAVPLPGVAQLEEMPEAYAAPEMPPFNPGPSVQDWLYDEHVRDQFCIRWAENGIHETEVFWSSANGEEVPIYRGEREKSQNKSWCERYVEWSPQGTYLVTFHAPGIALWGGSAMEKIARFGHREVQRVQFSPKETYMVTYDFVGGGSAVVWDVQQQKQLRRFSPLPTVEGMPAPFKWSASEKFLCHVMQIEDGEGDDMTVENVINIFELPSMRKARDPVSGKPASLRADGVVDFMWSPTDDVLAYWGMERLNIRDAPQSFEEEQSLRMRPRAGVVALVDVTTRKNLRSKNLVNVNHCKLQWNDSGNYLAAIATCTMLMTTKAKTKDNKGEEKQVRRYKFKNTMLEVFRVKERGCPFEHMELMQMVQNFAWEPTPCPGTAAAAQAEGTRFGMIYGELPYPNVGVWQVPHVAAEGVDVGMEQMVMLERRKANHIFWSPNGGIMMLAAYVTNHDANEDLGKALNGQLEFFDVDEGVTLAERSHYRCNFVQWDPSGRTVTTAVTQPIEGGHYLFSMDNGYMFWTFQGFPLGSEVISKESFHQFRWRPRPKTLMSDGDRRKVIKKLRKYERRFERADKEKQRAKALERTVRLYRKRVEMRQTREAAYERLREARPERLQLYVDGYDSEDEDLYSYEDVVVHTEVLSTTEVQD